MEALRDKGADLDVDRRRSIASSTRATSSTRTSIVKLFDNEKDPIQVIKWKELYGYLEAATDRCEDIANVLDGISVKHA